MLRICNAQIGQGRIEPAGVVVDGVRAKAGDRPREGLFAAFAQLVAERDQLVAALTRFQKPPALQIEHDQVLVRLILAQPIAG